MRKRILIPGAVIGGIAVYLASQFLSLNIGDISVPEGSNVVSVGDNVSAVPSSESSAAENEVSPKTVVEIDSETSPAKLLLIDVLIDDDRFEIEKVSETVGEQPASQRQLASVEEVVSMVRTAEGDKSGTRVRISRTPEAIASAETRLVEALQEAGINSDAIDRRNRLVER